MGHNARKPVFWGLQTTQAQTSLRIPSSIPFPLVSLFLQSEEFDVLPLTIVLLYN